MGERDKLNDRGFIPFNFHSRDGYIGIREQEECMRFCAYIKRCET